MNRKIINTPGYDRRLPVNVIMALNDLVQVTVVDDCQDDRKQDFKLFELHPLPEVDAPVIEQPKHLQRPYWDKKKKVVT